MAAKHLDKSQGDAFAELVEHIGADDLNALNNDQRIILASHRFAPEVTSAALWLNQKVEGKNLITCVKLTPHQDTQSGALYVQASTIIPVPGIDDYIVSVGQRAQQESSRGSSLGSKLAATFARNYGDEVTPFLRKVGQLSSEGLPDEIRPDRKSRWGGGSQSYRYYHLWYRRPPWSNWGVSYRVELYPQEGEGRWEAAVVFMHWEGIDNLLGTTTIHPDQHINSDRIFVRMGTDTLNDEFAAGIARVARSFIEQITPLVDDYGNESDDED